MNSTAHLDFSKNYEGTIYRDPDAHYEYKRSNALLKRKDFFELEAKPISFFKGEGRCSETLGSIEVEITKTSDLLRKCLGKHFFVGAGFADDERAAIWNFQSEYMEKTLLVKFQELSVNNVPRFPVFKGFRICS